VPDVLARALDAVPAEPVASLEQLEDVDARARAAARRAVGRP
jgi:hypothetical protein